MFRHSAVAAALWPLLAASLEAQGTSDWHWRTFTSRDGLAESWVRGVTRGPSGRVFISHGAMNALTVFDGYTMTSLPCPGPGLRVVEGSEGEAWASAWDARRLDVAGIQRFDGHQWIRIGGKIEAPQEYEGQIVALGQGRALALTPSGLVAVDVRESSAHVALEAGQTGLGRFLGLLPARDGGVWVTGSQGALHLDPTSGQRKEFALGAGFVDLVSPHEGRPGDLWGVASIARAGKGGGTGRAVLRLVGERFEMIAKSKGQPELFAGWPDPDGGHWLLRRSYDRAYLGHVSGGTEREASPGKVLSRILNDVLVDPDGGFWIAAGLGLARASPASWREPPGLPVHDGPFTTLVRDSTALFALHETGLLIRDDGGHWTRRSLPRGLEPEMRVTKGMAVLADGRLAILTRGPALFLYDRAPDHFEDAGLDAGRRVNAMSAARGGGLWLVTASDANDFRLDLWNGKHFRIAISSVDLAKLGEPRCLLEISEGDLWLGGISGSIGHLVGGHLQILGPAQGYAGRGAFSLFEAGPGRIWLGERSGIREFDGKTFTVLRDHLETVRSMVRGADGAVWVASGGGLHRFKDSSWLDLGTEDGLPDAGIHELLADDRGRLWVGTTNGLRVQDPEADRDPPRTELPGRAEAGEVSPRGDVQLVFGGRDRWDVTPVDRLLFSYRLDTETWGPFQKEAVALVRALRPGAHHLEVRSMDRSGNIDPHAATLNFRVLLPWYREPAVVGVSLLALVALALLGASIAHRYATLDRLVRERTSALDEANRGLRESEQRLRLVIDAVPALVAWKGLDARYLGANRAFALALGRREPEEVIGLGEHDFLPFEEAEALGLACQTVMDNDVPQSGVLETVHLARGLTSLEINRVPLHDQEGHVVGVLITATDVTARQEAERERERLEASLHQAHRLEAVGKLAGGIAHDFNNILTVIAGHAVLLTRRIATDHPAAKDVIRISEAVERATALTRQILAFSRGQVMQPRVLDLNAVLIDLVPLLSRLIGEDLELNTHLDPALRNITADPVKLEQVIMNLAVNARDAMPAGGRLLLETSNLEVREGDPSHRPRLEPGEYVMLAVTDNGSGMPPEVLDRVFEPFFTTKPTGQGTGLGLATVYGIVKQSGGDVWVSSEPGQGTTFKVYLPSTTTAATAKPEVAEVVPSSRGGGTVLLAEDEPALQDLVVETLTEAGYTVIASSRADEALERAAAHPERIDLLLTDVIMPGMSGPELARRLLELRPEMRVVFMSGYTANTLGPQGVNEQDVLEKPFLPSGLLNKLESVLKAGSIS
jgi:PAS domain S-box-containing protein